MASYADRSQGEDAGAAPAGVVAPGPGKRSLIEQLGAPRAPGPPGKQTRVEQIPLMGVIPATASPTMPRAPRP
ncbi:MAG TPA: hypothetical protein VFP84_03560, partial [Kofleriaceae bacterium]|nr:hypothetical protein [Kofleriaceae bacterium]